MNHQIKIFLLSALFISCTSSRIKRMEHKSISRIDSIFQTKSHTEQNTTDKLIIRYQPAYVDSFHLSPDMNGLFPLFQRYFDNGNSYGDYGINESGVFFNIHSRNKSDSTHYLSNSLKYDSITNGSINSTLVTMDSSENNHIKRRVPPLILMGFILLLLISLYRIVPKPLWINLLTKLKSLWKGN